MKVIYEGEGKKWDVRLSYTTAEVCELPHTSISD